MTTTSTVIDVWPVQALAAAVTDDTLPGYTEAIDMEDLMTPEQVAQYLHLSTDTIYRLIRGRKLAATRIGRTYRVPRQDLETFLAANSSRAEVRSRMFERAEAIGARNPDLDSDAVVAELEQLDTQRPSTLGL